MAVLVVGAASAVAWGTWGIYGWIAVTLAYGLSLFFRAAMLLRGGVESTPLPEGMSLVEVSGLLAPYEAELACQVLENGGVAATYYGRANAAGVIPGGDIPFAVGLGRVRVAVHERAAERATELLAELNLETADGHQPLPSAPSSGLAGDGGRLPNDALKAFGLDGRQSRLWSALARRLRK